MAYNAESLAGRIIPKLLDRLDVDEIEQTLYAFTMDALNAPVQCVVANTRMPTLIIEELCKDLDEERKHLYGEAYMIMKSFREYDEGRGADLGIDSDMSFMLSCCERYVQLLTVINELDNCLRFATVDTLLIHIPETLEDKYRDIVDKLTGRNTSIDAE